MADHVRKSDVLMKSWPMRGYIGVDDCETQSSHTFLQAWILSRGYLHFSICSHGVTFKSVWASASIVHRHLMAPGARKIAYSRSHTGLREVRASRPASTKPESMEAARAARQLAGVSQHPTRQRKNSSAGECGSSRKLCKARRDTDVGTALAEMPTLLLVGTINGSLNDVMYGVLNPTADSMRLKCSYVGDKFANCAVLATLERPTTSDPFRSHTLKWFEGDHPYIFRPIVKNRDFVFMEATGITELANGERVGYHVMHSVTFPGARAMNGNIRAHMAVCAFYRQHSDGAVEVFTKTTANPGGHVASAITVEYGATALISAQKLVACAHAKKLAWAVAGRASTSTISSNSSIEFRDSVCFNCGGNTSIRSRRDVCALCMRPICSSCRVKQSLNYFSWPGGLTKHKMRFCSPCASNAMHLDACALACEEFGADRPQYRHRLTSHLQGLTASDPNVVVLRPSTLSS